MHRIDQGLGAVGVLVLFVTLTILLGVGLPTIQFGSSLKASDWLGFGGNMIAGVLAGAAAIVAWVSTQKQIRHAAQQNSVIAYGTLREVLAACNQDAITNTGLGAEIATIDDEARTISSMPTIGATDLRVRLIGVRKSLQAIREAEQKLMEARANPWGNASDRALRQKVIERAGMYQILTEVRVLMMDDTADERKLIGLEVAADLRSVSLVELAKLQEDFTAAIEAEMNRIYGLIDQHFVSLN